MSLNTVIKKLFFTTTKLNIALHLMCVPSKENEADAPSRHLTTLDCKLHPRLWHRVQKEFGGPKGHTCDLMALDSNSMTYQDGSPLPHFTPHPSPQSCGVNFFAQDLSSGVPFLGYPYIFPPPSLMGPVLLFLKFHGRSCMVIALDVYPRKYWWPLIKSCARKSCRLAVKGEVGALLLRTGIDSPSRDPWGPLGFWCAILNMLMHILSLTLNSTSIPINAFPIVCKFRLPSWRVKVLQVMCTMME